MGIFDKLENLKPVNTWLVSVYGVDIGCNLITALAELPKKIRMKMEAGSQLYKVITRKI